MVPAWVGYRVGIRVGIPGEYPATQLLEEGPVATQRSGPRKPTGLEWVGVAGPGVPSVRRRGRLQVPPLRGPVGPTGPSLYLDP